MMMHKPLILSFLACLVPWQAYAEETTRILFIGNSYTAQIRNTVKNLIKSSPEGDSTQMEFICPGGKTLDFHQQTKSTTEKIKKGNWDYVVLQDQSQTPAIFPDKFERAAVNLDKMIDAAGAKTVFYQTWGRRDGDKHNRHLFPDYQKMQKVLSTNYRKVAKRCDAVLVPVGDTWAKVRKANPELGNALYKGDGSHPSSQGAYLAACVFYATLFEKSPASLPYQSGHPESETKVILEAVGSPAGKPEPRAFPTNRTLTNAEGHKIEASISGRSKTKVYFKTRSKSFVYDISQLSEASQTMIHRLPINR